MTLKFSQPTGYSFAAGIAKDDYVDIKLMALSTGRYVDMNGTDVVINKEILDSICSKYNDKTIEDFNLEKRINPNITTIEEFDNRNAPNQLGHSDANPRETVGHVIGLMNVVHEKEKSYLFMTVRVKGKENIPMVIGKTARWRNVSIQFSPKTHEFVEVSWVVKGADIAARSLLSEYRDIKNSEDKKKLVETIKLTQSTIDRYNNLIDAEKYLLACCNAGVITKATSNHISNKLTNFSNPLEVVKLIIETQPKIKFNPLFISKESTQKILNPNRR